MCHSRSALGAACFEFDAVSAAAPSVNFRRRTTKNFEQVTVLMLFPPPFSLVLLASVYATFSPKPKPHQQQESLALAFGRAGYVLSTVEVAASLLASP